jgi:hypothetical protein
MTGRLSARACPDHALTTGDDLPIAAEEIGERVGDVLTAWIIGEPCDGGPRS